jgi:hypothetical protein
VKRAWAQGRRSTTRESCVAARGRNSVRRETQSRDPESRRRIEAASGGRVCGLGRNLPGPTQTRTAADLEPGCGWWSVCQGSAHHGGARPAKNRRNRSPRGGHKDVAQRRAVSDDLSSGLEKPANAGQANGQRERSIRRTASVSWLVEKCHARTIHESHDVPRSSTPLVKIALPRRAVREPSRTLHAASPHRVVAAPPRHSGRAHNTAPCRRSPGSRGI